MIFDATIHRQLKQLPRCGVVYEFAHPRRELGETRGRCLYPSADRGIEPSAEQIAYAAEPLLSNPTDPCRLVVLDDESKITNNLWSNTAHLSEDRLEENRDRLMRLMERAWHALPVHVSGYGLAAPGYAHSEGYKETQVEAFTSRLGFDRRDDGRFGPVGVVEYLDFITGVGYPRSSDKSFDQWRRRMQKMLSFCRRWHRQVLIFVSPTFSSKHEIECPWFDKSLAWVRQQDGVHAAVWHAKPISLSARQAITEASR